MTKSVLKKLEKQQHVWILRKITIRFHCIILKKQMKTTSKFTRTFSTFYSQHKEFLFSTAKTLSFLTRLMNFYFLVLNALNFWQYRSQLYKIYMWIRVCVWKQYLKIYNSVFTCYLKIKSLKKTYTLRYVLYFLKIVQLVY